MFSRLLIFFFFYEHSELLNHQHYVKTLNVLDTLLIEISQENCLEIVEDEY